MSEYSILKLHTMNVVFYESKEDMADALKTYRNRDIDCRVFKWSDEAKSYYEVAVVL